MNRLHQRHRQKDHRRRNGEKAFLFDANLSECLAEIERDNWEWAIDLAGGNVGEAARLAGIDSIPNNARALWGKVIRTRSGLLPPMDETEGG